MKPKDRHGLLLLAITVALLLFGGWLLMRGSRDAMRTNAMPGAEQQPAAPQLKPQPATRP